MVHGGSGIKSARWIQWNSGNEGFWVGSREYPWVTGLREHSAKREDMRIGRAARVVGEKEAITDYQQLDKDRKAILDRKGGKSADKSERKEGDVEMVE